VIFDGNGVYMDVTADRGRSVTVPSPETVDRATVSDGLCRVYNYLRYRVGDGPEAEDLTAATFERAWRHRRRYRKDVAAFSTWLLAIARNVARDHFRRQSRQAGREERSERPDGSTVEEISQRRDELARLLALLNSLSDRERDLVALKYGAGMSNRAIAEVAGLSETNVGTILHRVVTRLRQEWESET
jgi:RNA polymerase sigma-70 factor (ECF subfamily)